MRKSCNSGKNHPKFINLEGIKSGNLQILEYVHHKGKGQENRWVWECKCSCGEFAYVRTVKLIKNDPQTCCKKCSDKKFSQEKILDDYQAIKNRVFRKYKRSALLRGYNFDLNKSDFEALLFNNCHYCNSEPKPYSEDKLLYNGKIPLKRNGIDRQNNNIGYQIDNCVTCCNICNTIKMDLSYVDFKMQIEKIYKNLIK